MVDADQIGRTEGGMTMSTSAKIFAAVALLAAAVPVAAQDFPTRPITLIVPYAAGGGNDLMARSVAEKMSKTLGQQIVIENRGGAGGSIATRQIAKSAPDGYTLGLGGTGTHAINPTLYANVGYDPRKDFAPVGLIATSALVVCVHPSLPAQTIPELIALAKKEPGKIRYASVGIGSNNHYDTEAFAKWAGIEMLHLPNKAGGAGITQDLVTGDAQVALVNAASSGGVIKGGQVRPLAVMSDERMPEYPDIPTLKELGYTQGKGLWSALYAPAATPPDVLETLHKAVVQALGSDQVKEAFKKQMIKPVPNSSIADAREWTKTETELWKKVVSEVKVELPE
jgi:tripartite-type tricarboxylate transporter receptor subunit TctC